MGSYDLFSKRDKPLPDVFTYDEIPVKLRNQILWIWKSTLFALADYQPGSRHPRNPSLRVLHELLCREHGLASLAGKRLPEEDFPDAFMTSEDTGLVLDMIEISFGFIQKIESHEMKMSAKRAVTELNYRFRENGIGYRFEIDAGKLIRIDNQFLHEEAVRPALQLLVNKKFEAANGEFLEAFDDYRKSDFDDCLTKCCSALESVMKVICAEKKWPFSPKDTAGPLLKTVIENSGLPSFFEQPILLIATLRNRLSKSHGAGTDARDVPEHLARYALHATASAIVLLVDAAM